MEFTVPQFIDYEAKIVGPLTFKQFIIVGIAGIICFAAAMKTPFYISIPVIIFVGGGAGGLTFLKIGGSPPLTVLKNFLRFKASPNVYVWKHKIMAPKIVIRKEKIKKVEEEEIKDKNIRKSQLSSLASKVETKT